MSLVTYEFISFFNTNSYIWIINNNETNKLLRFDNKNNNNLVIKYTPENKEQKILLETPKNITKIFKKEGKIYFEDQDTNHYQLSHLEE